MTVNQLQRKTKQGEEENKKQMSRKKRRKSKRTKFYGLL